MWTRSLLKSNAKQALQERYWRSVGLCLLLSLLGIGYSFPRLTAQYRVTSSQLNGMMGGPVWQGNAGGGKDSRDRCERATPAVDTPAAMRSIFCRHWPPLPGW